MPRARRPVRSTSCGRPEHGRVSRLGQLVQQWIDAGGFRTHCVDDCARHPQLTRGGFKESRRAVLPVQLLDREQVREVHGTHGRHGHGSWLHGVEAVTPVFQHLGHGISQGPLRRQLPGWPDIAQSMQQAGGNQ